MAIRTTLLGVMVVLALLPTRAAAQAEAWRAQLGGAKPATPVAVFNFQMKAETPDWLWLEKGLADRVITDLYQQRTVAVMQRDTMEALAEQLKWLPEMATQADQMNKIRGRLAAQYLISGLYEVKGETLTITVLIVEVASRREMARREVTGPAPQALELMRQASSEVVLWLTKRPAAEVLPELPVWTRSMPAAKALYEGMDLYDQGSYGEAWLSFRRAAQADPEYFEARYWLGKMWYFLNRYDHARLEFERFIYAMPNHPRAGDALLEYLDTYEKLDTPVDRLLEIYTRLEASYPQTTVTARYSRGMARAWLRQRRSQLLGQRGDYGAAVALLGEWFRPDSQNNSADCRDLVRPFMINDHLRTGHAYSREELQKFLGISDDWYDFYYFDATHREILCTPGGGVRDRVDQLFHCQRDYSAIIAPPGQVFKSLTIYPLLDGPVEGRLTAQVGLGGQPVTARSGSIQEAGHQGLRIDSLPRSGWLSLRLLVDMTRIVDALRVTAEFEPVGPHGAIEVDCQTTANFRVEVDGRPGRAGAGLVGLLAPGRHEVRFRPGVGALDCYGSWSTTVEVTEGGIAPLMGRLPWRPGGPLAGWSPATLLGRDYPAPPVGWPQSPSEVPTVMLDDQAVRVIWSCYGDLWFAESLDGLSFTPARRLEMPISSGWREERPGCLRDESGRWLLTFRGNRGRWHDNKPYLCWSRDLAHWSAPALFVRPAPGQAEKSAFDPAAYFKLFDSVGGGDYRPLPAPPADANRERIMEEVNGSRNVGLQEWTSIDCLVQKQDGRYGLVRRVTRDYFRESISKYATLTHFWSSSGSPLALKTGDWSVPQFLADVVTSEREVTMRSVEAEGRLVVFLFRSHPAGLMVLRETQPGQWQKSPWIDGPAGPLCDLAWNPRWGFVLSWLTVEPGRHGRQSGPYIITGRSIDELLRSQATEAVLKREAGERFALGRDLELAGDLPRARLQYQLALQQKVDGPVAAESRRRLQAIEK